jgi:phosphonate transport system permease protein
MARAIMPAQTADLARLLGDYAASVERRRRNTLLALAGIAGLTLLAAWAAEIRPEVFLENIGNFFTYVIGLFQLDSGDWVFTDPVEWYWGLGKWSLLLLDTVLMAYAGTLLGAMIGFALSFATSRNLVRSAWICAVTRRFLEFCRTVPDIVFALIFVSSFGLGPLPGVLAIATHTVGALGKLFSEVVENIDMKPVEGIAASGGSWVQQIRFGVLPQVQANFISYTLLRFEINVRSAGVLGFVGAGGIGFTLLIAIRKFYASDVSAMMLMIIATVMIIDNLTEKLRHRLMDPKFGKPGQTTAAPTMLRQIRAALPFVVCALLLAVAFWRQGLSIKMIVAGVAKLGFIVGLMLPPNPETWHRVGFYLIQLEQTLGIAFLGTLIAATLALPFGFLAAKNVVPNFVIHLLSRRMFDTMRGVDTLVWALIWINVVGLGPFAGALAIICSDFGALAKLFSEAIENADRKPVEGVMSAGGSEFMAVRYGVLPQVLPVILSQVLYFFESNTRSATIIGIVGAGGLGLSLSEMIDTLEWQQVSFIILMLLITVSAIDWLSTRLRLAIIGRRPT